MSAKAFSPPPLGLDGHNEQFFLFFSSCIQILFLYMYVYKIPSIISTFHKNLHFLRGFPPGPPPLGASLLCITPQKRYYHLHFFNLPDLQKPCRNRFQTNLAEYFKIGHYTQTKCIDNRLVPKSMSFSLVYFVNRKQLHLKHFFRETNFQVSEGLVS